MATTTMALTHERHIIRAHHLLYSSLLDDHAKHVDFMGYEKYYAGKL